MAKLTDKPNALYLDINIAGTSPGAEPIDKLQAKYTVWKLTTGITEPNYTKPLDFEIFPNPAENSFTLKVNPLKTDRVEITDLMGRVVFTQTIYSALTEINSESLNPGVYFINLYKDNFKTSTTRIIKN